MEDVEHAAEDSQGSDLTLWLVIGGSALLLVLLAVVVTVLLLRRSARRRQGQPGGGPALHQPQAPYQPPYQPPYAPAPAHDPHTAETMRAPHQQPPPGAGPHRP